MRIFILHGWSYTTDKWEPFLRLMQEKRLSPQLLAIPGLTAPIDRPWTLKDYREWLKKKVGREKVILIGHSNGGRISIAFALKYPELVERLILIDSAGLYHNELALRLKRFVFKNLARLGRKLGLGEARRPFLYKLARARDYKEADPLMRETMVNLTSVDLAPSLNKLRVPTLIIWGERDETTPLSDGKLMHKLIPHSNLHIVKDARHSPQFSHPDKVCVKINKWLHDDF